MPEQFSFFDLLVQGLGFIAIGISFVSYQAKFRRWILILQALACTFWTVHFLLLGGLSGAFMNLCAIVRALVFLLKGKVRFLSTVWTPVVFSLLFLPFGFLANEGILGFLPVLSLIISSFALYQTDEQRIRGLNLVSSPPFLVYDFLKGSYAGVVAEVLNMISEIIALIRFRKDRSKRV